MKKETEIIVISLDKVNLLRVLVLDWRILFWAKSQNKAIKSGKIATFTPFQAA